MRNVRLTEDEYRHLLDHLMHVLDPDTYLGSRYSAVTWHGKKGQAAALTWVRDKLRRTEKS